VDDTQLFLSMKASSMTADLLKLKCCLQAVKVRFAENENYLSMPISQTSCILEHQLNCAQHTTSPASSLLLEPVCI